MSGDYKKNELTLGIDAFDKPKQLQGVPAWSQLIQELIFLKPGTYPSCPEMGIGISQYDYSFIEDVVKEIENRISDQVRTYLPDIPLRSVSVITTEYANGKPLLIITLSFTSDALGTTQTAIAADVSSSVLNFEISW